ncbi:MAG: Flp pilus assembly protein CpaB [Christensenella sp.]
MKKIFQNRIVLACLAILLSAGLCFVLAPQIEKNAQEEVPVYVMKSAVKKGDALTEENIKTVNVPKKYLPSGAITEKDALIGKYTKTDFVTGDYIFSEKLAAEPTIQNDWYKEVNENNLAISITIKSFATGLSAKLEPYDIVSFVSAQSTGTTEIHQMLRYVKVLSVTTDIAQDYNAQSESEALPSTVTVLVTPEQATLLADLELNSTLHLALVSRGDAQKSEELLQLQQDLLNTVPVQPEEVQDE